MKGSSRLATRLILSTCLICGLVGAGVGAGQATSGQYTRVVGWAPPPGGAEWGQVPGMTIDAAGRLFVFRRAEPPIVELDADGKVLKTWGDGTFVWPHGIRVDRDGFLWIPTAGIAMGGDSRSSNTRVTDGC